MVCVTCYVDTFMYKGLLTKVDLAPECCFGTQEVSNRDPKNPLVDHMSFGEPRDAASPSSGEGRKPEPSVMSVPTAEQDLLGSWIWRRVLRSF